MVFNSAEFVGFQLELMFQRNAKDFVCCTAEKELMAACFVSCYWPTPTPSAVFFRKLVLHLTPFFFLSFSKEQIEFESFCQTNAFFKKCCM